MRSTFLVCFKIASGTQLLAKKHLPQDLSQLLTFVWFINKWQNTLHTAPVILYNLELCDNSVFRYSDKKIINYNIYRGSHISLSWFLCGSPILVEVELRVLVFVERGNWRTKRKNPWSKARTNNKLNPHTVYGTRQESNSGHIVGRQAFRPLHHPCSQLLSMSIVLLGIKM